MKTKTLLEAERFYHIYNRGNNRDVIFREHANYHYFLELAQKYLLPVVDIHAFALLPDHFHFLIQVKSEKELLKENVVTSRQISLKFGHFFNAYAKAYNKRYRRVSSLFQKNFGRRLITNEQYLHRVLLYIHWNPQKHEYVKDFRKWPFSSYQNLMNETPSFLEKTAVQEWFGGKEGFEQAHERLLDLQGFETLKV